MENTRGINFSKNFGKEAAIFSGLTNAVGKCCVVSDCDLQHPPQSIVDMYHCWQKRFEIIESIKISHEEESYIHKEAI